MPTDNNLYLIGYLTVRVSGRVRSEIHAGYIFSAYALIKRLINYLYACVCMDLAGVFWRTQVDNTRAFGHVTRYAQNATGSIGSRNEKVRSFCTMHTL